MGMRRTVLVTRLAANRSKAQDGAMDVARGARPLMRPIAVAAVFSGVPSTALALVRRDDPLAAARSAATIIGVPTDRGIRALAVGAAVHAVVSSFWGAVLAALLPRRGRVVWGAAAGAAIYVLDMEVVARALRLEQVRALPRLGQLGDHLAFGALIGLTLDGDDHAASTRNTG
jgi:hypothetical protein